ncbi:MAG: hypothetical protein ABI977_00565 [Acidobacteriota bacterium]
MNCKEFDYVVNDLARARLMDAAERERALCHAEVCGTCAARLANERALAAGLKTLATDSEDKAAPPQIEARLLTAFRQQHVQVKTNIITLPVRRRRVQTWAWAAAAVLLVAFAIVASQLMKNASSVDPMITLLPSPSVSPKMIPAPSRVAEQSDMAAEIADPDGKRLAKPRKKSVPRRTLADNSSVVASVGEFTPVYRQANGQEVTTDFLPLVHDWDSQPIESGQLIRVQMPRMALASFGLPVNQERANVPVKADVLLAEDGSARAIRFVR